MTPIARPSRGTVSIARCSSRDELVEATRDLDVALLGRVLIAQSRRAGSVARAVHELGGGGAGRRGDRVRGVPEIVKVELVGEIGDRGSGVLPVAVNGALAQDHLHTARTEVDVEIHHDPEPDLGDTSVVRMLDRSRQRELAVDRRRQHELEPRRNERSVDQGLDVGIEL